MDDKETKQSEDVTTSAGANIEGGVVTGSGDFVGRDQINIGRDQIIKTIINVGNLFDFGELEGLLPPIDESIQFETVEAALVKSLGSNKIEERSRALAFANSILQRMLEEAGSYRNILSGSAEILVNQLKGSDFISYGTMRRSIDLPSLSSFWQKKIEDGKSKFRVEYLSSTDQLKPRFVYLENSFMKKDVDFKTLNLKELRVFFLGLIFDLLRIGLMISSDEMLIKKIRDFLSSDE